MKLWRQVTQQPPPEFRPILLPLPLRSWVEEEAAKQHYDCIQSLLVSLLPEETFMIYARNPTLLAIGCDPLVEGLEADVRIYLANQR